MCKSQQYLGKTVKVKIDRPLGSAHPKYGFVYEVNYGYLPHTCSGDGEELDAYVLGVNQPVEEFEGRCIAVIHRVDDDDDKLIVVPEKTVLSNAEIERLTAFQEKCFTHELVSLYPEICLMCGFLGFGKTTHAKKLEREKGAVRLTHDEIMRQRFGRTPDNFQARYKEVDDFIRRKAAEEIKKGKSVILDYGFWSKAVRAEYYRWAQTLTPNVCFCALRCDLDVAKKRVLERTKNNPDELWIDENCFDDFLKRYEPITEDEGYPVVFCTSE